ncbi:MAG: metallophosphoesterase family protein [Clostridia bacterium]|nr:metallophosphoesterase family protein [Clostridia bacterium]
MKKIGVFSDTHGNYLALTAIMGLFRQQGCTEVIHCGDMITMGGQSMECLDYFFHSNIILIKGNHDRGYVLNIVNQAKQSYVTQEHKEFIYASLGGKYQQEITKLPLVVHKQYGKTRFAFCHYALSKDAHFVWTPIYDNPTAEIFDQIYDPIDADVIIFGHKHEPTEIVGRKSYIDVGSVGCHKQALAKGIIITIDDNGDYSIDRVSTPYDRPAVYRIMKERGVPDCERIFSHYFDFCPD